MCFHLHVSGITSCLCSLILFWQTREIYIHAPSALIPPMFCLSDENLHARLHVDKFQFSSADKSALTESYYGQKLCNRKDKLKFHVLFSKKNYSDSAAFIGKFLFSFSFSMDYINELNNEWEFHGLKIIWKEAERYHNVYVAFADKNRFSRGVLHQ